MFRPIAIFLCILSYVASIHSRCIALTIPFFFSFRRSSIHNFYMRFCLHTLFFRYLLLLYFGPSPIIPRRWRPFLGARTTFPCQYFAPSVFGSTLRRAACGGRGSHVGDILHCVLKFSSPCIVSVSVSLMHVRPLTTISQVNSMNAIHFSNPSLSSVTSPCLDRFLTLWSML
jgi:hypothetical protein